MKILIAAYVLRRREGGVAGVAYGVGQGLEQLGHEVEYLFMEDLPVKSWVPSRFAELGFALELSKFIRKNPGRFSVVNIHAPAGCVYGPLHRILPRLRANGPAYVMTLHGLEERRIHAMSREAKKGRADHFNFRNRLWHSFYHLPRFVLSIKTADHAVCVGRETWTVLQLKYNLDSDRVSYAPNGVAPRFFVPREAAHGQSARLLYAGTWLDQRGIFYLRDALRGISKRLPGVRLTIAGCGSGEEAVRNFFEPDLQPLVDVISMVPYEQMPALLAENDIFVFPSVMEGTPLAIQEAMAGGMAVVTTETCGMIDLVENEYNGLLIPPADSEALENAVVRLALDPDLRTRLGCAARETMKRFTWSRAAHIVEAACASALRRAGRAANISTEPKPVVPEIAADKRP
jgi:glycosyltransferase involved in cell wall biosynthesis